MKDFFTSPLVSSIIAVAIACGILFVLNRISSARKRRAKKPKLYTFTKLVINIIRYAVILVTFFILLQNCGIDITSILASVGVVGIIVGFALQDALKDIIAGVNIIMDNYYTVGDIVKVGNFEGKITSIGLKVTKLSSSTDGSSIVIANRNVTEAIKVSPLINLDLPVPSSANNTTVEKICKELVLKIAQKDPVKSVDYLGIQDFGSSTITHRLQIVCLKTDSCPTVRRDALGLAKTAFDKAKITLP